MQAYNNTVLTVTPHSTPDPFAVYHGGQYYLVRSEINTAFVPTNWPLPDLHIR